MLISFYKYNFSPFINYKKNQLSKLVLSEVDFILLGLYTIFWRILLEINFECLIIGILKTDCYEVLKTYY